MLWETNTQYIACTKNGNVVDWGDHTAVVKLNK